MLACATLDQVTASHASAYTAAEFSCDFFATADACDASQTCDGSTDTGVIRSLLTARHKGA